mgnify:CR=1 FL=1
MRFRLATYSFYLSIGIALGLLTIPAHAEKADKDKPIALSSDKAQFDDVKQIYYLERNVLLIKGSLIIKGEKAEVKIGLQPAMVALAQRRKRACLDMEAVG